MAITIILSVQSRDQIAIMKYIYIKTMNIRFKYFSKLTRHTKIRANRTTLSITSLISFLTLTQILPSYFSSNYDIEASHSFKYFSIISGTLRFRKTVIYKYFKFLRNKRSRSKVRLHFKLSRLVRSRDLFKHGI